METSSFSGVAWTCVVQGISNKLPDCKRELEDQTGNENHTVCYLTQKDTFTVFRGRE